MIERFFKKFTTKPKNIVLTSPLEDDQAIEKNSVASAQHVITIDVPQEQTCILYQARKELAVLTCGTHEYAHVLNIDSLDTEVPLDYFYLRDEGICEGTWALDYCDHHDASLSLSGDFSVKIDQPRRLVQFCRKDSQFKNDTDMARWIAQSISIILKAQRIPVEDIHAENVRFASFLRDALSLALRPKGLLLQSLSLNIHTQSPKTNEVIPESTDESATPQPQMSSEQTSAPEADDTPTVEQVIAHEALPPEKLFYYVRNGKQHGPFSHDDIRQMLSDGTLRQHDLLWQKGLTSWKAINEFKAFRTRS